MKNFCGRQVSEICLAVQVWEPGGDSDKRVKFMRKPPEPLWSFVVDSSLVGSLCSGVLRQDEELFRSSEFYKEIKMMDSDIDFLGLEDNAVLLPGRKLLYDHKLIKRQHSYKSTLLLPSVVTHVMFQSPMLPESLFSYCRKRNSDTEGLESMEVEQLSQVQGGFTHVLQAEVNEGRICLEMMSEAELMVKHQIMERPTAKSSSTPPPNDPYILKADTGSIMGCEKRDVHMQLFATFWPVFEFLSAVFEADFRAWINLCLISLINTKGVRVTDSQTYDLLDGFPAMKFAVTGLSILKMQVIYKIVKGDVSVVRDGRWTLNLTSDWFHSPRPPDVCLSEHYGFIQWATSSALGIRYRLTKQSFCTQRQWIQE